LSFRGQRQIKNEINHLTGVARRFMGFCDDFSHHFVVKGRDVGEHARSYLSGLVGTQRRKNIERIGEDVEASNYQGMQQLISDSRWDDLALMDQIAQNAKDLFSGEGGRALYLDETSFVKKGNASVGVQRQYCGRLGKVENCQVGVFGCLGSGKRAVLIDYRLFLPEAWANDVERCEKAKVPMEKRVHRTKPQLALEIVKEARRRGLEFEWVGGDEVYGNNKELIDGLEAMGEIFLMDVPSNLHVYEADPSSTPKITASRRPDGKRKGSAEGRGQQSRTVAALAGESFEKESRKITARETAKGALRVRIWVKAVWQWDEEKAVARQRLLIVRQEADGSFKYSLSNASVETSWKQLGMMQGQRFWIERAFQDAKSELGMAQYEIRGWRGWHHHMAMICLAMLFVVKERALAADHAPLLSTRDVVELLDYYLPRRNRTEAQVFATLHARHEQRRRDLNRHQNK
jgi:SRSO17 transposase